MIKPMVPSSGTGFRSQGNTQFRHAGVKRSIDADLSSEKLITEAIANVVEATKSGSTHDQKQAIDALQELISTLMREGTEEDLIAVRDRSKEIRETLNAAKSEIPDVDLYDREAEIQKSQRLGSNLSVDV